MGTVVPDRRHERPWRRTDRVPRTRADRAPRFAHTTTSNTFTVDDAELSPACRPDPMLQAHQRFIQSSRHRSRSRCKAVLLIARPTTRPRLHHPSPTPPVGSPARPVATRSNLSAGPCWGTAYGVNFITAQQACELRIQQRFPASPLTSGLMASLGLMTPSSPHRTKVDVTGLQQGSTA